MADELEVTIILSRGDAGLVLGSCFAPASMPLEAFRGMCVREGLALPSRWVFVTRRGHQVTTAQERARTVQQVLDIDAQAVRVQAVSATAESPPSMGSPHACNGSPPRPSPPRAPTFAPVAPPPSFAPSPSARTPVSPEVAALLPKVRVVAVSASPSRSDAQSTTPAADGEWTVASNRALQMAQLKMLEERSGDGGGGGGGLHLSTPVKSPRAEVRDEAEGGLPSFLARAGTFLGSVLTGERKDEPTPAPPSPPPAAAMAVRGESPTAARARLQSRLAQLREQATQLMAATNGRDDLEPQQLRRLLEASAWLQQQVRAEMWQAEAAAMHAAAGAGVDGGGGVGGGAQQAWGHEARLFSQRLQLVEQLLVQAAPPGAVEVVDAIAAARKGGLRAASLASPPREPSALEQEAELEEIEAATRAHEGAVAAREAMAQEARQSAEDEATVAEAEAALAAEEAREARAAKAAEPEENVLQVQWRKWFGGGGSGGGGERAAGGGAQGGRGLTLAAAAAAAERAAAAVENAKSVVASAGSLVAAADAEAARRVVTDDVVEEAEYNSPYMRMAAAGQGLGYRLAGDSPELSPEMMMMMNGDGASAEAAAAEAEAMARQEAAAIAELEAEAAAEATRAELTAHARAMQAEAEVIAAARSDAVERAAAAAAEGMAALSAAHALLSAPPADDAAYFDADDGRPHPRGIPRRGVSEVDIRSPSEAEEMPMEMLRSAAAAQPAPVQPAAPLPPRCGGLDHRGFRAFTPVDTPPAASASPARPRSPRSAAGASEASGAPRSKRGAQDGAAAVSAGAASCTSASTCAGGAGEIAGEIAAARPPPRALAASQQYGWATTRDMASMQLDADSPEPARPRRAPPAERAELRTATPPHTPGAPTQPSQQPPPSQLVESDVGAEVARLKGSGTSYEQKVFSLQGDELCFGGDGTGGHHRVALNKIVNVFVTNDAELEFSLDCSDHMVHMKAASAAELRLWLSSLREVAQVNKRRAEDGKRSQRRKQKAAPQLTPPPPQPPPPQPPLCNGSGARGAPVQHVDSFGRCDAVLTV